MNIDLGRVTPIYRGAYDAAESYELNDIVLHTDGALYWHTSETPTTGVAPTVTATWTLAFSGADVEAAIEAIKEDAEAIAFGTRGGLPVGSSDPYYHNNAAWYASQASASATDANAAKVAAHGAQGAAETARDKSAQWATGGSSGTPGATNNSKYYSEQAAGSAAAAAGSAQDAEAWAAGTKAGVPVTGDDPQYENNAKYWSDEAAASAATFVTDPTLSVSGKAADAAAVGAFNQYISLREEEDRQMLLGSVVQAVEDTYDELRSAPIHNSVTIGQSVYPRMDNTRLGLTAIKGRTVAMNQLVPSASSSKSIGSGITESAQDANGKRTISGTRTNSSWASGSNMEFNCFKDHVYMVCANELKAGASHTSERYLSLLVGWSQFLNFTPSATAAIVKPSSDGTYRFAVGGSTNDVMDFSYIPFAIDLTQMYGTTLADSIYAMETATPGAGVAYVRERMPLDYYAYNAGELKAPVVSGMEVTGKNLLDVANVTWKKWRYMNNAFATLADSSPYPSYTLNAEGSITISSNTANCGIGVELDAAPFERVASVSVSIGYVQIYAAYANGAERLESGITSAVIPANTPCFVGFRSADTSNHTFFAQIEVGSNATAYAPYQHESLPLPSTRLDGVGAAQDYIEAVEVGENDYSLVLHKVMGEVDLGTLSWEAYTPWGSDHTFRSTLANADHYNCICDKYVKPASSNDLLSGAATGTGTREQRVYVSDPAFVGKTAAEVKTALSGAHFCYELATPTETVLASHLTLADISAIAENGGIIGIVNSNGDIVQPDLVVDTVISRSAQ